MTFLNLKIQTNRKKYKLALEISKPIKPVLEQDA